LILRYNSTNTDRLWQPFWSAFMALYVSEVRARLNFGSALISNKSWPTTANFEIRDQAPSGSIEHFETCTDY
jgi:hypothetical protein